MLGKWWGWVALLLTNVGTLYTDIASSEKTWWGQGSLFGVVCFMTLGWVCPQPQQVTEYGKPFGVMLWVDAPSDISSRSSG